MTMASSTMASPSRTGVSLRKTNKPLMEKRRRARINESLSQLKSLVIQSNKKDSSQFNKLEKADILELTVKHLRHIQSHQQQQQQQMSQSANNDPSTNGKYQAGFMECAKEVMNYLGQSQNFSEDTKSRVISHLASCIQLANNKPSFVDHAQATSLTHSNAAVLGQSAPSNCQLANGQVIQIVNSPFQCVKTTSVNQFPVQIAPCHSNSPLESVHKPAVQAPASSTLPSSSESSHHIRYAQPLHIQIPPVVSPVLVPSQPQQRQQKTVQQLNITKAQSVAPRPLNLVQAPHQQQDTIVTSSSLSPQRREISVSPQPMRLSQKYSSYHQHEDLASDFIPRSRTYSITSSSSSESELMSPLNLSHSPQYSDSQKSIKYSSPHSFQSPVYHTSEKISPGQQLYKDHSFPSHYSSHVTSVIVDGRKNIDLKYMNMVMDEDRHCFRLEGSSSPASSVGEERLWRPW